MNGRLFRIITVTFLAGSLSPACFAADITSNTSWLSPSSLAASPDGTALFIGCTTGERVLFFDVGSRRVKTFVQVPLPPTGLAVSSDGHFLYVTCAGPRSQVCVIDVSRARITARLNAGHTACAPVLSPTGKALYVCNRFNNSVDVIDLAAQKEVRHIPVKREPVAAVVTLDGKHLLVANHLHMGRADADCVAAVISVIDAEAGCVVKELQLPNGSGLLNGMAISPDGKYAVVSHILARFPLPTTQLDRGWMNTNAKTLIALDRMEVLNTILLDNIDRGAANPWGVAWSADGKRLVVALAGTHEVSVTDFPALLEKLSRLSQPDKSPVDPNAASHVPADVPNDLAFLVGVRERRPLPEGDLGPRGIVVVGRIAYTANYFSDTLTALELDGLHPRAETIALGPTPQMTAARHGELYFNDGRICFQGWQSCASCHPGEGRADGLDWDLLNDGLGNPKNNKSLLLAFKTPPAMSTGVRESAEAAVEAGILPILFSGPTPGGAESIGAYIRSLAPVASPHLVAGKLSASARRGERLFRSKEVGCTQCHPAPLFTDLQAYDVGTCGSYDRKNDTFDTPTLIELWRTAPYLHDGSSATVRDVLTKANQHNEHGKTSHLTAEQIDQLVEYLLSL
jgi:YVTN family beta-propeller protein